MISSDMVTAAIWGALLTIFLEILLLLLWLQKQPVTTPTRVNQLRPQLPNLLPSIQERPEDEKIESCAWFTAVTDFIFQELRDSNEAKRLIMKRINKEFTELLLTKMEGKMINALTIREYSLGQSLPVFTDISLVKLVRDEDSPLKRPQTIELELSVSYSGSFTVGIDAQLMFDKSAHISLEVRQLRGRGRFQMTREPFTHWSFSFLEDPFVDLNVMSSYEGIKLPHLSTFWEAQIKRWLKKKHTLPYYKVRFKPFFKKFKPHDQLHDVYLHNDLLTFGELTVQVVECTRLSIVDVAVEIYCTLSIDSSPQEPKIDLWRNTWPIHEMTITRSYPEERLGMKYVLFDQDDDSKNPLIIISEVNQDGPAHMAGLAKGDVLVKIDNVKVTSVEQANKLIGKLSGLKLLLTIQRPTINLVKNIRKKRQARSRAGTEKLKKTRSSTVVETVSRGDESFQIINQSDSEATTGPRQRRGRSRDSDTHSLLEGQWAGQDMPLEQSSDEHRPLIVVSNSNDERRMPRPFDRRADSRANSPSELTTKRVAVCRNPIWNDQFNFHIGSNEDRYLNVCVCCHLQGEASDIVIGYVSISLSDIAVECSLTSCGYHQQRYVLVPAKVSKIGTSRAALKVTSGHFELPATAKFSKFHGSRKYVGDILLRFTHTPGDVNELRRETKKKRREPEEQAEDISVSKLKKDRFSPSNYSEHRFVPVDLKRSEKKCHVCSRRIWKKAFQCKRCCIVCDTKCVNYCKKMVRCYSRRGERESDNEYEQVASDEACLDNDWEYLTYSESRQLSLSTRSDDVHAHQQQTESIDYGPCSETVDRNIDDYNVTPLDSNNSGSEDEQRAISRDHSPSADQRSHDSMSRDRSGSPLHEDNELHSKILMAQQSLELLAIEKQELQSTLEDEMTEDQRDNALYKMQKLDAQIEATQLVLTEKKATLRELWQ